MIEKIKAYVPVNAQEKADKELMLKLMEQNSDIYLRTCLSAHMTASAWVVNEKRDKVLMAYHKIYDSWAWLGGHADGDRDLLRVALKEAGEESGIKSAKPVNSDIFSLEIVPVSGHEKKGSYVPTHLHLNLTYLIEADENEEIYVNEAENSAVGWFAFDEAIKASNETWIKERIYRKLIDKILKA